jgi:hypothetical protein
MPAMIATPAMNSIARTRNAAMIDVDQIRPHHRRN